MKLVKQVWQSHGLTIFQICLVTILLLTSVTVRINWTWTSSLLFICLLISFTVPKLRLHLASLLYRKKSAFDLNFNPFKGQIGPGYLTPEKEANIAKAVSDFVLYDANSAPCLKRFNVLKVKSECIFARRSKLWGSSDFDEGCSLEENITRIIPTFYKFTMAFQDLSLDAFLIELPGHKYGSSIEIFGDAVRRVLLTLRKADLRRQKQALVRTQSDIELLKLQLSFLKEDTQNWSRRSWVFEFNKITFFITTFAPFYPETNSRYSFGCADCYILFQPEIAFAIRDLPEDTAETNWDNPVTVRDKIRVAFREAGREYEVPKKLNEPMVYEIVKKVYPYDEQLQWWLSN